jgi:hypothetical protein
MTLTELRAYWLPACERVIGNVRNGHSTYEGWSTYIELDILLGIREYRDNYYTKINTAQERNIPDDLKRLLIALAGPHSKAILKAYRIRKGLDE